MRPARHPCYEFGGPQSYTYTGLPGFSFAVWGTLALLAEFMPSAPLTRGQVALMRRDNVASQDLPDLRDLHVAPTALDDVLTVADAGRTARC